MRSLYIAADIDAPAAVAAHGATIGNWKTQPTTK
jgi:hypothetical protein